MNEKSNNNDGCEPQQGVRLHAGDSPYIPAGALQIWTKEDGTLEFGVTLAVDPWLPDLAAARGTTLEIFESILGNGFSVNTICNRETVYGCQLSTDIEELISHPEIQRLSHMVVIDGQRAVGVLDLDVARGKFRHRVSKKSVRVADIYEPLAKSNSMQGEAPLMEYLLTADQQPFRLVEVDGGKLATVDVEDLQKVPVRAVLLMWFSYLESILTRELCEKRPELREIVRTDSAVEAKGIGSMGPGPERRIERFKFAQLLNEAKESKIISLPDDEIQFLNRYRNKIFHGPRWYVTRRREVASFVNCVRKVVYLARELAS